MLKIPHISERAKFTACMAVAAAGLVGAFMEVRNLAAFDDEFAPACEECPERLNAGEEEVSDEAVAE